MGYFENAKGDSFWLVIAVLLLGGAAYLAVLSFNFQAEGRPDHYVQTTGVVDAVIIGFFGDTGNRTYDTDLHVVVDGTPFVFRASFGTESTERGDSVPVFYDPASPESTFETDTDRRSDNAWGVFIAVSVAAAGLLFFRKWRTNS